MELLDNESPFQLFRFRPNFGLQLAVGAIGSTEHHNELFVIPFFSLTHNWESQRAFSHPPKWNLLKSAIFPAFPM
jgi:hypothetical protein